MMETAAVHMTDPSKVAEVRRLTIDQARALAWNESDCGKAALLATELATNLVKHASSGSVIIVSESVHAGTRLRLMTLDHGPGMKDVEACMRDGFSTAGSPGTGLGAVRRIANLFDIYSTPEKGTVVVAELNGPARQNAPVSNGFSVGGVSIAYPGETAIGDSWDYFNEDGCLCVLVCDGLGHGVLAAEASRLAVAAFRARPSADVTMSLNRIHEALRVTRGAAAAIAAIDRRSGTVRFCGIGNIVGSIVENSQVRHLVSHNGILGHSAPRISEFSYPWNDDCQLVMHSDGVSGRWRPDELLGLWRRAPSLIAGAICRDWIRGRDDATVVVARPS
jgi:anti-sigma regulatory factor (Ser/Thr protein kinase)/serine/threonine protein phosphatase PrpC